MNQTELQRVGNINPDGVGGLFSSFSYKNIFLDFSIDFRIGGDVTTRCTSIPPHRV